MNQANKKRSIGRRGEDSSVREQNERFSQLCEVGKTVTAEIDIGLLFPLVMNQTNIIMGSRRSSVFLYDEKTNELWSLVATGMKDSEIRFPSDKGVAGWVFTNRKALVIDDAYNDPRFNVGIDCKSGFRTENILCVPLINSKGDCIGVLQALNSKKGKFTDEDNTFFSAISDYVAIVAATDPDRLSGEKLPMDVSVLFVDLHNFSNITENHDPRVVNHMVENHFSSYLRCIHNHTGELNETSGDGIMVIFKNDTIENAAFEAVSAALEIIEENKNINREYKYPWGGIDLHMGISTGKAYVGTTRMKSVVGERWTYTASGFVTILASRIGSLSKKSRLYIGPNTHKMIHERVDCQFINNYKLKNVSKKIPIYQVTGIATSEN